MSVYFQHDTYLSSTKGSSCYRWYINVYIGGCAEANGFNFLEILIIDCFINSSAGCHIFVNVGTLILIWVSVKELFKVISVGKMINSNDTWQSWLKVIKPIQGSTLTRLGVPGDLQTLGKVSGAPVEITVWPWPIDTAEGDGVAYVVTIAVQTCFLLSLSSNNASMQFFFSATILKIGDLIEQNCNASFVHMANSISFNNNWSYLNDGDLDNS